MTSAQTNRLTDQQLMELILQDDREAFDQIYSRYWKKLFVYAGKVVRDEDEAQDIVQEVFVSLWQRRQLLININSLSSYLHGAIRFRGLGYIRANLYRHNYLSSIHCFFEEGSDLLNEHIDMKELDGVIHSEIAKLPPKMREIFILSRIEQMSHKEIAERLNISDKTVKKQINRSLNLFRLVLDERSGSLLSLMLSYFFFDK
ncbi:RNA polymerase sigma-70 factor [Pedobacter nyackensis]|uniref:RNA polymerase sigma-70 factor, ECF subfamily n=1 Tax=Pedobacter nyackensis TaxID=475255 RepID=A0A1W2EU56_9SPHI|nr:RNA polymerase sigma-70 factor [Pedobacter nyackensis]SMD13250.1 RNA polymerase sigma-70 factor, ECF subfamily [Pedobacter nyackensis]